MDGRAETRTRPRLPSMNWYSSPVDSLNSSNTRVAMGINSSPSGVSVTLRVSRSKIRVPRLSSARRTIRLSAG